MNESNSKSFFGPTGEYIGDTLTEQQPAAPEPTFRFTTAADVPAAPEPTKETIILKREEITMPNPWPADAPITLPAPIHHDPQSCLVPALKYGLKEIPADLVEKRVIQFISICAPCSLTHREISQGCDLAAEIVKPALENLMIRGDIVKTGELNTATYRLSVEPVQQPAPAAAPYKNPEMVWSAEAAQREFKKLQSQRPQEPRHVITEAEIDAAMPAPVKHLTEAERKELRLTENYRNGPNQNAFIRRG